MGRDNTKIYRDRGQLSINSIALGFQSFESPGFVWYVEEVFADKAVEETKTAQGEYHMGWRVYGIVTLAQIDANTLLAAFRGMTTGTTVTIDDDTLVPGTDVAASQGMALSWVGTNFTITAPVTTIKSRVGVGIHFGLTRENAVPFLIRAFPDANNLITVVGAT